MGMKVSAAGILEHIVNVVPKFFVILGILAIGCAKLPPKEIEQETKIERPEWIFNTDADCSPMRELCAVGPGDGPVAAEVQARKALAQIFQTRIVGKNQVTTMAEQKVDEGGLASGHASEFFSSDVSEVTEEVLKGVVIKRRFEDKDKVYALASLDKVQATKILQREMEQLDERMENLVKGEGRGRYGKLKKLYDGREALNSRYLFLKGQLFPQRVSLQEIEKKRLSPEQFPVVYVNWEKNPSKVTTMNEMAPWIIEYLTRNDFKVVTERPSIEAAEMSRLILLKGQVGEEELFMKVEGFKKYTFHLNLFFENLKGERIHSLKLESTQTGRDRVQALHLAYEEFKKALAEKLDELDI